MNKLLVAVTILWVLSLFGGGRVAYAHQIDDPESVDDVNGNKPKKEKRPKKTTGWAVAPLPIVMYSSDVGLDVGFYLQMNNYGDGKSYPNYHDEVVLQGEYMTSGAGRAFLWYNSYHIIPHHTFTLNTNFYYDRDYDFRGYNGYNTPMLSNDAGFKYYQNKRISFDVAVELALKLKPKGLQFIYGADFFTIKFEDIQFSDHSYNNSLYTDYVAAGIIRHNERNGGSNIYLKAGMMYDSRNLYKTPSKGLYSYFLLSYSPDLFNGFGDNHLKLSLFHTQYINLYKQRLVLAYRLAYQGVLAGDSPFYLQQALSTFQQIKFEGLGGTKTIRGVLLNRVVGRGVALANIELRYDFLRFHLFRWDVDLGTNPFFDMGMVVQRFRPKEMDAALATGKYEWICNESERPHCSYGIGLKAAINRTFVLSVEVGLPVDHRRDGSYGLSLRMDYTF